MELATFFRAEKAALEAFLENESECNGGLAYELADSMLDEINEAKPGALINLPPLKQALLNYVLEQDETAEESRAQDRVAPT